jgi:hypothetical protein
VAADGLREELLALPGVADAEVDEAGDTPSGVRVKLSPDADAGRVGVEVQRILAAHGLRSRLSGDGEDAAAEEETPGVITGLPDVDEEAPPAFFGDDADVPPPAPPRIGAVGAGTPPAAGAAVTLASVRIEETREGISATAAASDGRTVTERGAATTAAMDEAVVAAVGTLADGIPPVILHSEHRTIDGTEVVTVVVEWGDGRRGAGAALVRASRAYAVGRATWAALEE